MRRILPVTKAVGKLLLGFLSAVLIYALFALGLGIIPVHKQLLPEQAPYEVILFTTGIHLDICFPVKGPNYDWREVLGNSASLNLQEDGYLSFGWGDSAFYVNTPTWDDMEAGTTLAALLWPTPSAMHTTSYTRAPMDKPHAVKIAVTDAQWIALANYVTASIEKDDTGAFKRMTCCAYYGTKGHQFYEGAPIYHAFHTCNDWVNRGLKQAGIRAVVWTPVDRLVLRQFE